MKKIEKNKLCHYCLGCNKLELESFNGVYRCNNFVPGIENWQEKYRNAIIKEMEGRKK